MDDITKIKTSCYHLYCNDYNQQHQGKKTKPKKNDITAWCYQVSLKYTFIKYLAVKLSRSSCACASVSVLISDSWLFLVSGIATSCSYFRFYVGPECAVARGERGNANQTLLPRSFPRWIELWEIYK